jgi:imidazolonepropionase-like amidohydrolase
MLRLLAAFYLIAAASAQAATVALVGATLVDTSNFGRSSYDVRDSVVVIRDGRIVAAGPRRSTPIPADARRVDATGKWLVPGLIDGFSAQLSPGYAYANLAMGITTISQTEDRDPRRGSYVAASPQPELRRLGTVLGYDLKGLPESGISYADLRVPARRFSEAQLRAEVAGQAAEKKRGVMLMYSLDDDQVRIAVDEARKHGLFTIGELGHASYIKAAQAGVNAFIHTSRIELELTPDDLHQAIADHPFGGAGEETQRRYSAFLRTVDSGTPAFRDYARTLSRTGTVLMPTMTIATTYLDDTPNPWASPVAPLIDPATIRHLPFDRATGRAAVPDGAPADYVTTRRARGLKSIETMRAFHNAGVHFIAASGAAAFGVLPGWGLHREMALLVRSGLTPREALAAATENYSRAFGWTDIGKVAPGRRADLLLLDADPTRDIANAGRISAIWLNGERVDRDKLLAWRPPAR